MNAVYIILAVAGSAILSRLTKIHLNGHLDGILDKEFFVKPGARQQRKVKAR